MSLYADLLKKFVAPLGSFSNITPVALFTDGYVSKFSPVIAPGFDFCVKVTSTVFFPTFTGFVIFTVYSTLPFGIAILYFPSLPVVCFPTNFLSESYTLTTAHLHSFFTSLLLTVQVISLYYKYIYNSTSSLLF